MNIDPIEQALEVIRGCWKEPSASDLDLAIATAMCAQEITDWLVASVYTYKSTDTPKAYTVILWRPMNQAESLAKIQIKPVTVHWDVNTEKFVVVNMSRLQ